MAPAERRRVSYVIPPHFEPVTRLQAPPPGIPRLGSVRPLLVRADVPPERSEPEPKCPVHPRHRLGIAALALDTSTQLIGHRTPEGILYSGGRDGLIISWELGLPMAKRIRNSGHGGGGDAKKGLWGRWEMMTGWGDDVIEEEAEDTEDKPISDGDILGDVQLGMGRFRKRNDRTDHDIPYERTWEVDMDGFTPGTPARFRQCAQAHNDWVNDIILCNHNQTVVSASSDGTVKAWNPHSHTHPEPDTIGLHNDYVRCLTYCREKNWVASASFDRTIKLWDLSRTLHPELTDPLITLNPPDSGAPKCSVYAVAADPFGHVIASGSPEKVVRIWDPRSGRRTGKLVGHTDNIRAILISEDSRYLLTGSADASIKLWSLATQRCLHTFVYHTESVWSLFSTHPTLEVFYSGDKTGIVCKVDVEGCADVSEGECVVLCKDSCGRSIIPSAGINRILVMDDSLLWTASSHSSIKRWQIPPRRAVRAYAPLEKETDKVLRDSPPSRKRSMELSDPSRDGTPVPSHSSHGPRNSLAPSVAGSLASDSWVGQLRDKEEETALFGIPFDSLVWLASAHNPFTLYPSTSKVRDAEVATLYSATSVPSTTPLAATATRLPNSMLSPPLSHPGSPQRGENWLIEDSTLHVKTPRAEYCAREVAADARPLSELPDNVIEGAHGLVRSIILNDRMHALTVDTSGEVAVWDLVRCICLGRYLPEDVAALIRYTKANKQSKDSEGSEWSPREALEAVLERIESEAVVVPWSTVDTKTGVLTVHINEKCFDAEIYSDEAGFGHERPYGEEARLNIGKWVLRNLFIGFVREEQHTRRSRDRNDVPHSSSPPRHGLRHQPEANLDRTHQRTPSESSRLSLTRISAGSVVISSSDMTPVMTPIMPPSAAATPLLAPLIPLLSVMKDDGVTPTNMPLSLTGGDNTSTSVLRHPRAQTSETGSRSSSPLTKDLDYFAMRPRKQSITSTAGQSAIPDENAAWGGAGGGSKRTPENAQTPGGGTGGFMGRLKNLGKSAGKKVGESPTTPPGSGTASAVENVTARQGSIPGLMTAKTPRQLLLSGPLNPPCSNEAPSLTLPPHVAIIISGEGSHGWMSIYRGTVGTAHLDFRALEETMPIWLLEYLLANRSPPVPLTKISFIMLPWPTKDPSERLPELLNTTQSKLTASRFLRVRKLTDHVQDKLEKLGLAFSQGGGGRAPHTRARADDLYEILCNDVLLPLDMTLAAVRQYVWKQSAELALYYRKKAASLPSK